MKTLLAAVITAAAVGYGLFSLTGDPYIAVCCAIAGACVGGTIISKGNRK